MQYVLIVISGIWAGGGTTPLVFLHDFTSQEHCQAAADKMTEPMRAANRSATNVIACVPK